MRKFQQERIWLSGHISYKNRTDNFFLCFCLTPGGRGGLAGLLSVLYRSGSVTPVLAQGQGVSHPAPSYQLTPTLSQLAAFRVKTIKNIFDRSKKIFWFEWVARRPCESIGGSECRVLVLTRSTCDLWLPLPDVTRREESSPASWISQLLWL